MKKNFLSTSGRIALARRIAGVSAAAAIGLSAMPAWAQSEQSAEEPAPGAIIVTATKQGSSDIQDTPYNISAVGQEQLNKTGATTLDDVMRQVPGVLITGDSSNKTIIIRGLAATAGAPQVSLYLDETLLPGEGGTNVRQSDFGLYDIERVEVLRGPQGTLYGAGSQGGTVRYITNKPDSTQFEGSVGARVGVRARDGGMRYEGDGMLNVPIAEDLAAVRAVGYWRQVDGFVDIPSLDRDQSNKEETYGGRLQFMLTPGPDTSLLISGIYQKTELEDTSRVYTTGDFRGNPVREPYKDELKILSATLDQGVGFGTVTATISTYQRNAKFVFDQSQYVAPAWGSINQDSTTDGTTGELRFASDFDAPLSLVGGIFFESRDFKARSAGLFVNEDTGLPFEPEDPFFIQPSTQEVRNKAAFINAAYDITPELTVDAGIRFYEFERTNNSSLDVDLFGRPLGPRATQHAESDGDVKRFRISWNPENLLLYATYSEGFREGGPNTPGLVGNYPESYDPDVVKNYELGWKSDMFDRQVTLNGAVYYMVWDDVQVGQSDETGAFNYTTNAGKADLKGGELEMWVRPDSLRGFTLNVAARYSDQKLSEDNPLATGPNGDPLAGLDGERIPYTNKFSLNAGAEQEFDIGELNAFVRADVSYQGPAYTTFSVNDPLRRKINDYWLADLRAGIDEGTWQLSAYVKNLFNERAFTNWTIETVPGIPDRVLTTEPREVGIQGRVNF